MRHLFEPLSGLTPAQFHLLRTIHRMEREQEKNGMSVGVKTSELARRLEMSPPSVTQRVNELEQMNYIVRTHDIKDRRVNYLRLTDAGGAIMEQSARRMSEFFERVRELMGKDNAKEFARLCDIFQDCVCQAIHEQKSTDPKEQRTI